MIVRRAVPDDAKLLPQIERSAGSAFVDVEGLEWIADDEVLSADDQAQWIKKGLVWVTVDEDDDLSGFLTAEQFTDEIHIWELAVSQDHQKKGIGRMLMDAVLDEARLQNMSTITLTTFRELAFNELFYAKLGFQTLKPCNLSSRLISTLAKEVEAGLPGNRRCAMRLDLIG